MRFALGIVLAAGALFAQHSYTPADIEDGGRLYGNTCAACHGANGDRVSGVDLMHGRFRRAATDDGVAAIIQKGIPGTAMPPHAVTDFQAGAIVAYLRSVAAESGSVSGTGDAARGRAIFEERARARPAIAFGTAAPWLVRISPISGRFAGPRSWNARF